MALNEITSGISILQQWRDYSPNLFEVKIITDQSGTEATLNNNITKFYCSGFTLPAPSLDLERHAFTKQFFVKNYNYSNEMTIDWREDINMSVFRYHDSWISCFYDRWNDTYISGSKHKKRDVQIVIQQIADDVNNNHNVVFKDVITLTVKGLIPTGGVDLISNWNETADSQLVKSITYNFDSWEYIPTATFKMFQQPGINGTDDIELISGATGVPQTIAPAPDPQPSLASLNQVPPPGYIQNGIDVRTGRRV